MFRNLWQRLLRRTPPTPHTFRSRFGKPRSAPFHWRPQAEGLESRVNPNTTLGPMDGGLLITIAGPDTVNLSTTNGQLVVSDTTTGQTITDSTGLFALAGAAGSQTATETGNLTSDFASITVTGTGGGQTVSFMGGLFGATNVADGTIPAVAFAAACSFSGPLAVQTTSLMQNAAITGTGAITLIAAGNNTALAVNADVISGSGPVTLQATGDVVVGAGVTVSSGSGTLTLGADLTAAGMGDDGVGTLKIGAGASVYGGKITLRGADEDIASSAHVGSAAATFASTSTVTASATLTGLHGPQALAVDSSGNLYIANSDSNTVSKVLAGAITASATLSGLSQPTALAFDSSGNLYVANFGNNTVSRFAPGATTAGATLGGLSGPTALAFDGKGNLYVASYNNNTVSEFAPGATAASMTLTGLVGPAALAFDSQGNLYVANYLGNSVSVFAPGTTTAGTTINMLSGPTALALDANDNLYVANYLGNTVSEFAPGAMMAGATLSGLSGPTALMIYGGTNICVANYNNNTVSVFTPGASTVSTTLTGLSFPAALAFDGANLYVANSNVGTVSKFAVITQEATATATVTIQSSVPSRPMSLGGTNNAAVAGINLTSAELAQIVTAASGEVIFGGNGQTGDILFTTAVPATTPGATTSVVQAGAGRIILDDAGSASPALNGNGGLVSLVVGTGGIVAKATNQAGTADISNTSSLVLNSAGPLGSTAHPLQLAATPLITSTMADSSNQYLIGLGTILATSLNAGTGTITLSGNSTFQMGAANSIQSASSLTVDAPTIVDLNGFAQTAAALNGAGFITNNAGGAATLTVTAGGLFSGVIEDGGTSGATALVVDGYGKTLLLTGNSSYSGSTTVIAGILQVEGSITSAVTVSGGLLTGDGTVGDVTVSSGTLQPGDSPGTLHTGNLSLGAGSIYLAQIGGTAAGSGYNQDAANGTISLNAATLSLQFLNGFLATSGQSFVLIANAGTTPVAGTFAGLPEGAPVSVDGQSFHITYAGGHGYDVALIASAAPVNHFVVTPQGSTTVTAGNALLVMVQAVDPYGNPLTAYGGPATATASVSPISPGSNFPSMVTILSGGVGLFLATFQKAGTYTITVASGPWTGTSVPLTVQPGPAFRLGFATQPINVPTGVALPAITVQVLDAYGNVETSDNTDAVTLGIASGPGSFTAASTTTATMHNGIATFSNVALIQPGSYTLSELVTGLYTGPASKSFTVAPLQVVPGSFVGTPSGFSLQFNAPILINATTPVLYGQGFGATAPAPSVTVTGPSGRVAGSLKVNTATNTITFVQTDTTSLINSSSGKGPASPLLPDGIYTVDLSSSAAKNGFQALNSGGGFLDGKGTGTPGSGDFTATFTVTAAASHDDVVWVPPTADGPLQTLSAPGYNQLGGGFPIYINDTTGNVTSVQVTFNYNPAMLSVTGATSNSAVPGSKFTLLASSTPGQADLQYTGTTAGAAKLVGGAVPLGFLTATVPNSSAATPIYHGKDLLHLSGISINAGSMPAAGGDAVHLVAFVGDADGNGTYSSADAVLITRVVVATDNGFTAYPLVDPTIVADTDGSGFVPSDAALQANEAGVGFATANLANPPIPSGALVSPIASSVFMAIHLPSHLQVEAHRVARAVASGGDAHPEVSTGLIAMQPALAYKPLPSTLSAATVTPGSLPANTGWSINPAFAQPSLGSTRAATAIASVASASPNEQDIVAELHAYDPIMVEQLIAFPSMADGLPSLYWEGGTSELGWQAGDDSAMLESLTHEF